MRIVVDVDKCTGAGSCVAAAPTVFDQRDDNGIVVLLNEHPSESEWESARMAAAVCPSVAITVEE